MTTHVTHFPLDPEDITAVAWLYNDTGELYVSIAFDEVVSITLVDKAGRMHPQVFTHRLRELADRIDADCDRLRDQAAHVGQLIEDVA